MSPPVASSSRLISGYASYNHALASQGAENLAAISSDSPNDSMAFLPKHHPYRIDVQDVNPVSITFLISLRPPPISQLHQDEKSANKDSRSVSNSRGRGNGDGLGSRQRRGHREEEEEDWDDSATAVDLHDIPQQSVQNDTGQVLQEDGGYSLNEDGNAHIERTLNMERRREEVARLERFRRQKDKQHQIFLQHMAHAKAQVHGNGTTSFHGQVSGRSRGSLPSSQDGHMDDDADANDLGEEEEDAITSPSALVIASALSSSSAQSPVSHLFAEGVSVLVDGSSWKHVLMSDSHPGEAVIVVFGLRPGFRHKVELCIGPEAVCNAVGRAKELRTRERRRKEMDGLLREEQARQRDYHRLPQLASEADHSDESYEMTSRMPRQDGLVVPDDHASPRHVSPARSRRSSFNGDRGALGDIGDESTQPSALADTRTAPLALRLASLQAELAASQETRSQLSAEVRKARKDASRTEAALRNEIEAVKRGLERMSGTDHRSKQKVLALQESIRQANMQAEEAEREAKEVELGLDEWRIKEEEREEELKKWRMQAQEKESELATMTKETNDTIGAKQKALDAVIKKADEARAEAERLEHEDLATLLNELEKLKEETEKIENAPIDVNSTEAFEQGGRFGGSGPSGAIASHNAFAPGPQSGGKHGRGLGSGRGSGRTGPGGKGRKQQHPHVQNAAGLSLPTSANEFVPSSRSFSQPNAISATSSSYSPMSSATSFALNPHNPEFVPSSVLLAQAQREQQQQPHQLQSSTPPHAHAQAHGPPPPFANNTNTFYSGVASVASAANSLTALRNAQMIPALPAVPAPPPPLPLNIAGPPSGISAFQPFSPIDPSPTGNDTQHSSPARGHHSPLPPFGGSMGGELSAASIGSTCTGVTASSLWPASSVSAAAGFGSSTLVSPPSIGAPRSATASSPWNSPRLGARRGSGLGVGPGGVGLSSTNVSPSLGPLPSAAGAIEKDIWANPASSRTGSNIWGPLSGLPSAAVGVGVGVRDRDTGAGSVGSGGGSGSIHGHTLHHRASNSSGGLREVANSMASSTFGAAAGPYHSHYPHHHHLHHPVQHPATSPLLAYVPGVVGFNNGPGSSPSSPEPQSPSSPSFAPGNAFGFGWDRSTTATREGRGSDGSTKAPSPIQPPSAAAATASGKRSPVGSPLAAHVPLLALASPGPSSLSTKTRMSASEDAVTDASVDVDASDPSVEYGEPAAPSPSQPRSFASVAATQQ